MRLAILWAQLAGYFDACLRAAADEGHEILLVDRTQEDVAPYGAAIGSWIERRTIWERDLDVEAVARSLDAFEPDALLVCSWHVAEYRNLAKAFKGRAPRVLCMDNWWRGTPRQWVGRLISSAYIRPLFDFAFLPGLRSAQFARHLGFKESEIITGLYSADTVAFSGRPVDRPPGFLFCGRLVEEKGLRELMQAHEMHLERHDDPWPLLVAGTGPLLELVQGRPAVTHLGFVQPDTMPEVLSRASAFVLPSHHEHWGVAVHEAASAGLALCCTTEVAAADRFLQDGYNGFTVPPGDARALSRAMDSLAFQPPDHLRKMQEGSRRLAEQLTPSLWVANLTRRLV